MAELPIRHVSWPPPLHEQCGHASLSCGCSHSPTRPRACTRVRTREQGQTARRKRRPEPPARVAVARVPNALRRRAHRALRHQSRPPSPRRRVGDTGHPHCLAPNRARMTHCSTRVTPNCHVKRGCHTTDGVNVAAESFTCAQFTHTHTKHTRRAPRKRVALALALARMRLFLLNLAATPSIVRPAPPPHTCPMPMCRVLPTMRYPVCAHRYTPTYWIVQNSWGAHASGEMTSEWVFA